MVVSLASGMGKCLDCKTGWLTSEDLNKHKQLEHRVFGNKEFLEAIEKQNQRPG